MTNTAAQTTIADLHANVDAQVTQSDEARRRGSTPQSDAITDSPALALELEEAKSKLAQAEKQAEAATITKSRFLANMSHEVRTPLNSILGFSDLLIRGADNGDAAERENFLKMIRTSGKHLLDLINDLLDLSGLEAGELKVELIECSPCDVLKHVCTSLQPKAEEKSLELEAVLVGGTNATIRADAGRLRQVLSNLVDNAIKFTEQGSVRVEAEIVDPHVAPRLRVQVRDTGVGIAPEVVNSVFQPFFQADTSVTRTYGGSGLGLAIAKRVAEALGGTLSVRSTVGEGTIFCLDIPTGLVTDVAKVADPTLLLKYSANAREAEAAANGLEARILLVEDGETNRKLITHMLQQAGARITTAENGQVGVEKAVAESFDLILMDMQMPVMDGYTATRVLQEKGVKVPIIALTAHALDGDERKCLDAGCTGYVAKPVDTGKLVETVARYLGREEPGDVLSATVPHTVSNTAEEIYSSLPQDDPTVLGIIRLFVRTLGNRIKELEQAWRHENDLAKVREIAHWLRGSAGTAGFDQLTEPATHLGQLAREGRIERIDEAINDIAELTARIAVPGPQPDFPGEDSRQADENDQKPLSILLVEDDVITRRLMAKWLDIDGHEIRQAENGETALESIRERSPDVIVTDWQMPLMSGVELARRVRAEELANHPYILVTTANAEPVRVEKALGAGADDFLAKPLSEDVFLSRIRHVVHAVQQHRRQETLAETDSLTGLFNRRKFEELSERENSRAVRYGRSYSIAVVDIDLFKGINDRYGHATGDDAIRAFAELLVKMQREMDAVCRFGGDEFCVLLPETSEQQAAAWAERFRAALEKTTIRAGTSSVPLKTTIGVAQWRDDVQSAQELIDLADQALLAAKQQGRNRVQRYAELDTLAVMETKTASHRKSKLAGLTASDIMTAPIATVHCGDSVRCVAQLFLQLRINSVPVIDDDEKLAGIVSEQDLLGISLCDDGWDKTVSEIMTSNVAHYDQDTPAMIVWNFLRRVTIRRVVIVSDGRPVGVVSRGNLLRWLGNWDTAERPAANRSKTQVCQRTLQHIAEALKTEIESLDNGAPKLAQMGRPTIVNTATRLQELATDILGLSQFDGHYCP